MALTQEDKAKDRAKAAKARLDAADLTRTRGSNAMSAGAILLAGAIATFAGFDSTEIASWVRQVILTLIAILFLAGTIFYAVGRMSLRQLEQLADDRAAQEERDEELLVMLRGFKRHETFMNARQGADGEQLAEAVGEYGGKIIPLPSADTLDMVRKKRRRQLRGELDAVSEPPTLEEEIQQYLRRQARDDEE